MAALIWSESLALQQPQMDETHHEFVELLAAVEAALPAGQAALLPHYDRFVAHCEDHFAQEDRWLATIGFDAANCHATQHAQVLELLRVVQAKLRDEGDVAIVGQLVPAVADWFVPHAQNMDAGLAQAIALTGLDTVTGVMRNPPQAPGASAGTDASAVAEVAAGCGSGAC